MEYAMRLFPRVLLIGLSLLALTGCADLGITNPFASTSDVKDVYLSQFPDIPIPADMKSVPKYTMVTPTQDGTKVGLETLEGRVDSASLANAMIHNMARQGWSLRGSVSGKRSMQLHEKDQRFAVLYLYDQTIDTRMEVWVLNRLAGGGYTGTGFESLSGAGMSTRPATGVTEQWEGGVSSQALSQ